MNRNLIFIFSEKFFDTLADALPDALPFRIAHMDCLAARGDVFTVWRLAGVLTEITGRQNTCSFVLDRLADFLAENDHIHADAFVNVCLEGIS